MGNRKHYLFFFCFNEHRLILIHGRWQIIMASFIYSNGGWPLIHIHKIGKYVLAAIEASVGLAFVCLLQFCPNQIPRRRKTHPPATLNVDLPANETNMVSLCAKRQEMADAIAFDSIPTRNRIRSECSSIRFRTRNDGRERLIKNQSLDERK